MKHSVSTLIHLLIVLIITLPPTYSFAGGELTISSDVQKITNVHFTDNAEEVNEFDRRLLEGNYEIIGYCKEDFEGSVRLVFLETDTTTHSSKPPLEPKELEITANDKEDGTNKKLEFSLSSGTLLSIVPHLGSANHNVYIRFNQK